MVDGFRQTAVAWQFHNDRFMMIVRLCATTTIRHQNISVKRMFRATTVLQLRFNKHNRFTVSHG